MNLKDTYNLIAEEWHKDHSRDDWWQGGTDKFISLLKPGALVLDAGCGAGTKSKYLTAKGVDVIGIDFSEKMIEIAKREVPGVKFEVLGLKNAGRLKKKFDGIFAQASLLHIPKKEVQGIMKKLSGLLEPGGYFYVAVKEIKPGRKEEEIVREKEYGHEYERFFSYYTLPEIKKYFENLKMKVVYEDVATAGKSRWIQVIAQKRK